MARVRWPTPFARLPIRARLTIAFVTVMSAVLASAGVIVYGQFTQDLDADIDATLDAQVVDVVALVEAGAPPAEIVARGERLTQVYAADGRIVASPPRAEGDRLLTDREARRAVHRKIAIGRRSVGDADVRIHAAPVKRNGQPNGAIAVAEPLHRRDNALSRLRTLLLIAGPLALLLASLAGYELSGAALRPVERMRTRAEQITDRELFERLPVPETNDEIGALGRTLNALLARLEAAVMRERRLVSDASHELRTPLTTLRAEVDLALRGDRDREELRAALESASEEAKRMTRLADDLLILARADQGRLPVNPEPVAAAELLRDAAARATAAARERGQSITAEDEGTDGAVVSADRDRVAQALDNLVTNALRYGAGTVTLAVQAEGDLIELHVTDEGGGFGEGVIDLAFERFGRGDEARASGSGSGLGLSIVEVVAEAHGGRVGARNRPDGGADVWIALPRA